jgi:hypothetical protein
VLEAGGVKIDGLGNRKGVRHSPLPTISRGGNRPRKRAFDDYGWGEKWVYEDAKESVYV